MEITTELKWQAAISQIVMGAVEFLMNANTGLVTTFDRTLPAAFSYDFHYQIENLCRFSENYF